MSEWKVNYTDIIALRSKRPFHKCSRIVEAETRKEAIEKVKGDFPPPKYMNFRASKSKDKS